jgi:hypothetical protein
MLRAHYHRTEETEMNPATQTIWLFAVLSCFTACAADAPLTGYLEPGMPIELPPNTKISVDITATDCHWLQKTVIHWPDGSKDEFQTPGPTLPGQFDHYGTVSHTTGPVAGEATVEVLDRLPADKDWHASSLRRSLDGKTIKAEGHPGPNNQNWTDTVVTFTW